MAKRLGCPALYRSNVRVTRVAKVEFDTSRESSAFVSLSRNQTRCGRGNAPKTGEIATSSEILGEAGIDSRQWRSL
jgi:hypothetical protein